MTMEIAAQSATIVVTAVKITADAAAASLAMPVAPAHTTNTITTKEEGMTIQAVDVKRDDHGMWAHPEHPNWDEETSANTINAWFERNNIDFFIDKINICISFLD